MIKFSNVSKNYADGTVALNNVNFEVVPGEFCILLGHSGAGKSTLLRTVNGLVEPSGGYVSVAGQKIDKKTVARTRREVAMIHQEDNLSSRSSVAVNVMAGALVDVPWIMAMLGCFPERIRKKACFLLETVGLEEKHLSRRARTLSGGQQQRV